MSNDPRRKQRGMDRIRVVLLAEEEQTRRSNQIQKEFIEKKQYRPQSAKQLAALVFQNGGGT